MWSVRDIVKQKEVMFVDLVQLFPCLRCQLLQVLPRLVLHTVSVAHVGVVLPGQGDTKNICEDHLHVSPQVLNLEDNGNGNMKID